MPSGSGAAAQQHRDGGRSPPPSSRTPCPAAIHSGSATRSMSVATSPPSGWRAWTGIIAARSAASSRNVASVMPSGLEQVLGEVAVEAAAPDSASRTRPTQSVLMPYSHRAPGSNSSGADSAALAPVSTVGCPGRLVEPGQLAVEEEVAVPGGVGEEVAQRGRRPAGPRGAARRRPTRRGRAAPARRAAPKPPRRRARRDRPPRSWRYGHRRQRLRHRRDADPRVEAQRRTATSGAGHRRGRADRRGRPPRRPGHPARRRPAPPASNTSCSTPQSSSRIAPSLPQGPSDRSHRQHSGAHHVTGRSAPGSPM